MANAWTRAPHALRLAADELPESRESAEVGNHRQPVWYWLVHHQRRPGRTHTHTHTSRFGKQAGQHCDHTTMPTQCLHWVSHNLFVCLFDWLFVCLFDWLIVCLFVCVSLWVHWSEKISTSRIAWWGKASCEEDMMQYVKIASTVQRSICILWPVREIHLDAFGV